MQPSAFGILVIAAPIAAPKHFLAVELVRKILLALLSSLAEVEAQKISERTEGRDGPREGKGSQVGRPRLKINSGRRSPRKTVKKDALCHWEGSGHRSAYCREILRRNAPGGADRLGKGTKRLS